MDATAITNIILCVLSFVLAAISVVTVVITLRQNHKMIENSTRPYLTIYHGCTFFDDMRNYLILKNFGTSSAIIEDLTSDCGTSGFALDADRMPFAALSGTSLAPGQKVVYAIDGQKFTEHDSITFSLKYRSDSKRLYCETVEICPQYLRNVCGHRASTKNAELQIISFALQDIAEKML